MTAPNALILNLNTINTSSLVSHNLGLTATSNAHIAPQIGNYPWEALVLAVESRCFLTKAM